MSEVRFLRCSHCGNLVESIENSGVPIICCGEPMKELTANTVEASREKHLPVVERSGNNLVVKVGSAAHPMIPEHSIQWIYLQTDRACCRKALLPGDQPQAVFALCDGETPVAVYAYCNLHGLWKTAL